MRHSRSRNTVRQWLLPPKPSACGDDDAVVVAVGDLARDEHHAAELDCNIALPVAGLGALPWVGAQRLDPDRQRAQHRSVADCAVDDQPGPAVVDAQAGDEVADQCAVQRTVAVDHQHPAVAWLGQYGFQQRVVLEAAHRGDRSGELGSAPVLAELQIAAADVGADFVDQVSGGAGLDSHRSMLGERAQAGSAARTARAISPQRLSRSGLLAMSSTVRYEMIRLATPP